MTAQGRIVTSQLTAGVLLVTNTEGYLPTNRKTGAVREVVSVTSELTAGTGRKRTRQYSVNFADGATGYASPATTWTLASDKQHAAYRRADEAPVAEAAPAKRSRKAAAKRGPAAKPGRFQLAKGVSLAKLVRQAGSSYRKLGAEIGVNPHTINRLNVGRVTSVNEATAVALALGLGQTVEALFVPVAVEVAA